MVATKSCNTIAPVEQFAVDAAGFVRLRGCFDGFSTVMLSHRYVILWEPRRLKLCPKKPGTPPGPGGKKVAKKMFPTCRCVKNEDSGGSLEPGWEDALLS